ncbi:MAG: phytanoyl-CoA dioxygenase family protein [Proteobacteria bacterium]|nr:phytanoyl-CoA dioxygenase family protein [Pseudomonadota bacterium]
MDTVHAQASLGLLANDEIVHYRQKGYLVLRGLLGPKLVAASIEAISGLASGRIPAGETKIMFEPGIDPAGLAPAEREDKIRKLADYTGDAPALRRAAMLRRLHASLDQLLGQGRVLFQEMALIKPPFLGSEKPWHQDFAYFRVSDPSLIVGVWIALDRAAKDNGCMEVVPGSHLAGPAPHVPMADINVCHIEPSRVRVADRVAVEMEPGDALIFHPLLHHYTAPNSSPSRRRAVQFHYHQIGLEWTSLEEHRRQYHDDAGAYAGCTVPKGTSPPAQTFTYRGPTTHPIVPMDDL